MDDCYDRQSPNSNWQSPIARPRLLNYICINLHSTSLKIYFSTTHCFLWHCCMVNFQLFFFTFSFTNVLLRNTYYRTYRVSADLGISSRDILLDVSCLGRDSPSLKLCYLCPWRGVFQWQTLLVEKTVIVEVGESRPCMPMRIILNGCNLVFDIACWHIYCRAKCYVSTKKLN